MHAFCSFEYVFVGSHFGLLSLPLNSSQWMQRYSQVKLSPEKHVANVLKSWASQRPLELHIDTFALHLQKMLGMWFGGSLYIFWIFFVLHRVV